MGNCNNDKSNLEPEIIGIPEACRSYLKNVKLGELLKHVSHAGRMQKLTLINYIQIFICSGQWVGYLSMNKFLALSSHNKDEQISLKKIGDNR